jgi:hypothetical protein
MPKKEVYYEGKVYTVDLAIRSDGSCPAKEYLDHLFKRSKKDWEKIIRPIKRLADFGEVTNPEHFKKIEGTNFWEFKSFQIRVPCFFSPGNRVVITHGFTKKKDRIQQSQLDRMKAIRNEYERRT